MISLYGLKQASREWYVKIDCFFLNLDFEYCDLDHSIYVLHVNGEKLFIAFYVDDLFISRNDLDYFRHEMRAEI
jgi:hypothetical protein